MDFSSGFELKDVLIFEGARDFDLSVSLNEKNEVNEHLLTDGKVQVIYAHAFSFREPATERNTERRIGHVRITNASYVITTHVMYIKKDLKVTDVMGKWFAREKEIAELTKAATIPVTKAPGQTEPTKGVINPH